MAEILTESFCERCGTRYTFESGAPKARLKGLKVMSRGLRNFVMSDDTSIDEAMAAARNETDREQTSHQLDAFHKTFNFCMSCRQYTCGNCWNEAEGRCLSCAPNLGQEIMPAPFGNVAAGGAMTVTGAEAVGLHERNGHEVGAGPAEPLAWPTSDLMREAEAGVPPVVEPTVVDATPVVDTPAFDDTLPDDDGFDFAARLASVTGPAVAATPPAEPPVQAAPEPVVEPEIAAADVASADADVVSADADVAWADEQKAPPDAAAAVGGPADDGPAGAAPELDDRAAAAAVNTSELFQRFRPGQSIDDEIEAYERAQAAETAAKAAAAAATAPLSDLAAIPPEPVYPEAEPVPVETFEAEPDVAVEPEPEPIAALPEPVLAVEPEPAAAWPEPSPAAEPRVDVVPQPTWQITAPDAPGSDGMPAPPVQEPTQPPIDAVAASAEPQWPSTPQWPERDASAGLPFLGRPSAATGGIDALWAASAQEVARIGDVPLAAPTGVKPGGVQPCVSCGLSLSANARFCRRCGTRQG